MYEKETDTGTLSIAYSDVYLGNCYKSTLVTSNKQMCCMYLKSELLDNLKVVYFLFKRKNAFQIIFLAMLSDLALS